MVFKNSAALTYACLLLAALAVCHATSQGLWSSGSLSSARYLLAAASLRDQVIFAGGSLSSSHTCRVDRYSASTDSWTQECLSVARSWLSAASISLPAPSTAEFALFAGGLSLASTPSNRIDIFNSQTSSWSVSPVSLSVARFAMAAASLDSLSVVFFAGGREQSKVWGIVDALKISPSGSIEASVLNMSVPRHALCATSLPLQSVVIFAGGFTSAGSSSSVVDIYDASSREWTVSSLSVARSYLAATTLVSHSLAFFAGGWTGTLLVGNCSKVVDIYNGATKTWTQATLSVARHFLAAGALELQGIVVFAGGLKAATQSFTGQYSNDIDIYVAPSNSWTTRTLVTARSFLVPAVLPLRGLLYLGGGFTGAVSDQVDVWDVRTDSLGPSMPTITLSNPARGGEGISMTISMVPANPVPANGKIVITLPGSFNCSAGTPVFFSPRGNPERSGAASIGGSILTISILTGTLYGGDSFSMTFTGVTNPSAPQAFSSAVNAATLNENGLTIGSSSVGSLVAVVPNLGPGSPSISLSSVLASQKQVSMTVSLLPEVSIPFTGRLLITLSGTGWALSASSTVEFLSAISGAPAATASIAANSSVLTVQFASGQFPAHSSVSFRIPEITMPPAAQALSPNTPLQSRLALRIASALTDVSSVVIGSSVQGTMPHIIDDLGCGADFYFEEIELACSACKSGKASPAGSTSEAACQNKINVVGIIVGVFFAVLVAVIGYVTWRFWIWNRRYKVFELLDNPPGNSEYRTSLMRETSKLPRPTPGASPSQLHDINKTDHPKLWEFVESKMRHLKRDCQDGSIRTIHKIEFCRTEREDVFLNKLFDDARTEVAMDDYLKFQKPTNCPQFDEGLEKYKEFCEKLNYSAKIGSFFRGFKRLSTSMTKVTADNPESRPGINLSFQWHAGPADVTKKLCDDGIQTVAISTDPGYFGKGLYLSPHFEYAERYGMRKPAEIDKDGNVWIIKKENPNNRYDKSGHLYAKQANEDETRVGPPEGAVECHAIILWACALPLSPYVVTKRDYPLSEPPLRDAGVPYGFSKFYGRPMQRACSAHFVSTKRYTGWPKQCQNPLHNLFKDDIPRRDIPEFLSDMTKSTKQKYIRTWYLNNAGDTFHVFQHVCVVSPQLPENWREEKDHSNRTTYVNYNVQPPSRHADHPVLSTGIPLETKANPDDLQTYPHTLIDPDYQYCPEKECEGHELVLQDKSMVLPVAVVYVKFVQPSAPPLSQSQQTQSPIGQAMHYPASLPSLRDLPPVGGYSRSLRSAPVIPQPPVALSVYPSYAAPALGLPVLPVLPGLPGLPGSVPSRDSSPPPPPFLPARL